LISDSFIGKMKLLFPTRFSSLTLEDLELLLANDSWVGEVFDGFWDIAMEKFKQIPRSVLEDVRGYKVLVPPHTPGDDIRRAEVYHPSPNNRFDHLDHLPPESLDAP